VAKIAMSRPARLCPKVFAKLAQGLNVQLDELIFIDALYV
jgi:hypothetical protein